MTVIDQARPEEWQAALELAYQHMPTAMRHARVVQMLHMLDTGELDPAGIWIARQRHAITGVQICWALHGCSFLFWLPEIRDARADKDALVQAALAWCRAQGGKLAQSIMPPADAGRAEPLLRQGFKRVTQLLYLEHNLQTLPAEATDGLGFAPFDGATEGVFRETLTRTYEGTLDCPELNGVRTIDEILAGYRAARAGRSGFWSLVRMRGAPAGVLILTELLEEGAWDLSYIGVVPEHRRHGVGRAATCHGLRIAHAAGAAQMVIAVDVRNDPARRLYASLGFVEADVRDVYLQVLRDETPLQP
jgi:mycothiol synthase